MHRSAEVSVAEHALGSVAEGEHAHAVGADRYRSGLFVHRFVAQRAAQQVLSKPAVEDARAVQAQQNAVAAPLGRVVDVHERVDARLGIVARRVVHGVDDARGAGRRGRLARMQHPQREGVVRLITGPVGDRRAGSKAQRRGRFPRQLTLSAEGGHQTRHERMVDPQMVQQPEGGLFFQEVPEDPFRKARDGGGRLAGHAKGHIVARKQPLVGPTVDVRLVFKHPAQLGGRKVAGTVEQVAQAAFLPQLLESAFADRHGPAVAPDDGRAQHAPLPVDQHQPVHLVGDADAADRFGIERMAPAQCSHGLLHALPPLLRILLGPARMNRFNL